MAGLINILGGELYRRERQRQINKTLRDHSDPFQMPEENFRQFFRLSREAAFDLFLEIEPHMEVSRRNTRMAPVIRFISSLYFFAHGSYQKSVGKDSHCALSQLSVSKCLKEVVSIMNEHLGHHYIHFPSTVREIAVTKNRCLISMNIAAKIIYACAILHNILRERNIIDDDLEHNIEDGIEDGQDGEDGQNGDDGQNGENLQEVDLLREAREIRNNLILQVFA
ncbi:hypothetical protein JTB14_023994 [Gonioctena quinquepunctata]|nr:hypothetical protein JTB14_023994 [Gonioctena quinquepunctata]